MTDVTVAYLAETLSKIKHQKARVLVRAMELSGNTHNVIISGLQFDNGDDDSVFFMDVTIQLEDE
jgi:hypothetical protein